LRAEPANAEILKAETLKDLRAMVERLGGVSAVAPMLGCGRSHLSQVLNARRPGRSTLRKLERLQVPVQIKTETLKTETLK